MPAWIFFLHRSYANKSNKIYFIFFTFFLDFTWILQTTAEIKQQNKRNPPTSGPHWSVGGAACPARPRTPWRAAARQAQGRGPLAVRAAARQQRPNGARACVPPGGGVAGDGGTLAAARSRGCGGAARPGGGAA